MALIFKTQAIPGGYTWSAPSLLGKMLSIAQEQYGDRDKEYTLLGVELVDDGPRIWYPGNCKHVVIQLSTSCENDIVRASFQLSHEVIHCLAPTGAKDATMLEEGVAAHFSMNCPKAFGFPTPYKVRGKYLEAKVLYQTLMKFDPAIIKKIRVHQPIISHISVDDILRINPEVPLTLIDELIKKF